VRFSTWANIKNTLAMTWSGSIGAGEKEVERLAAIRECER
jgi:hypothetical protein